MTIEDVEWSLADDALEIERGDGDDEPLVLELEYHHDILEDSILVRQHPDGSWRVGYLAYDSDCDTPEDADGVGYIYNHLRDFSREMHRKFEEALGLDQYGNPRFDPQEALRELCQEVWPDRRDKDEWDMVYDRAKAIDRENVKITYRRHWDRIVKQHEAQGDFGDLDRVMLHIYQHGGMLYKVAGDPGPYVDAQWDWSFGAGVWVPDDSLREYADQDPVARRAQMLKRAGQSVEQMNDWMNGSCYGYIIQWFTPDGEAYSQVTGYSSDGKGGWREHRDTNEAVWGMIGRDGADEELKMAFEAEFKDKEAA